MDATVLDNTLPVPSFNPHIHAERNKTLEHSHHVLLSFSSAEVVVGDLDLLITRSTEEGALGFLEPLRSLCHALCEAARPFAATPFSGWYTTSGVYPRHINKFL